MPSEKERAMKAAEALLGFGEPDRSIVSNLSKLVRDIYKNSGARPDMIVMHPTKLRELEDELRVRSVPVRKGGGTSVHKAPGMHVYEFDGIPVQADPNCKVNEAHAIPKTPGMRFPWAKDSK